MYLTYNLRYLAEVLSLEVKTKVSSIDLLNIYSNPMKIIQDTIGDEETNPTATAQRETKDTLDQILACTFIISLTDVIFQNGKKKNLKVSV